MHMPSGQPIAACIYHGESVARAMLPARLRRHRQQACRNAAQDCVVMSSTTTNIITRSESERVHKPQAKAVPQWKKNRKRNRISVHIRTPMEASIRFC
jgi:hypothetical protein